MWPGYPEDGEKQRASLWGREVKDSRKISIQGKSQYAGGFQGAHAINTISVPSLSQTLWR